MLHGDFNSKCSNMYNVSKLTPTLAFSLGSIVRVPIYSAVDAATPVVFSECCNGVTFWMWSDCSVVLVLLLNRMVVDSNNVMSPTA